LLTKICCVVLDCAGKPFERTINFEGTLRFTSPCAFEYMAVEKDKIIMVGEKI